MPKTLDLQGKKLGRLLVIRRAHAPETRNAMWHCKCDCGNTTIAAAANIGKTTMSCGCLASENGTEKLRANRLARKNLHGKSQTTEWRIWAKMRDRCQRPTNAKYPRYGGRGISVCERWKVFKNFLDDMGLRPSKLYSIDRIDNDGNYEPGNCRWATSKQQSRNSTNAHFIEINGISMCIVDWCGALGVPLWKPNEMIRGRGRKRDKPPECATIEEAITELYHRSKS